MADQIIAELKKIPPVTRVAVCGLVGVTVPVMAKLLNPASCMYWGPFVWGKLQLWRIPASFFVGSTNINFVFECAMLYRGLNSLETQHFARNSSDLAWQFGVAGAAIIIATRPLGSVLFLHALLACISYISAALSPPGAQTSLMGLVTVPTRYFPYVMVIMDLLMAGSRAAAESVAGLIVGHLWWWGIWGGSLGDRGGRLRGIVGLGRAPAIVRKWMGEREEDAARAARDGGRGGGATGGVAEGLRASGIEVVPPRNVAARSRPEGHSWGSGQRLGDS